SKARGKPASGFWPGCEGGQEAGDGRGEARSCNGQGDGLVCRTHACLRRMRPPQRDNRDILDVCHGCHASIRATVTLVTPVVTVRELQEMHGWVRRYRISLVFCPFDILGQVLCASVTLAVTPTAVRFLPDQCGS